MTMFETVVIVFCNIAAWEIVKWTIRWLHQWERRWHWHDRMVGEKTSARSIERGPR